jgi:hypothetical protein
MAQKVRNECSVCGQGVTIEGEPDFIGSSDVCTMHYDVVDETMLAWKYGIPFGCPLCGSVWSEYRPLRDIVVLWAFNDYPPWIYNTDIIIPEAAVNHAQSDLGIVLRVGPGYFDRDKVAPKRGHLDLESMLPGMRRPIVRTDSINVGDIVTYDKGVPWAIPMLGLDRNPHHIVFCGALDVFTLVEDHDLMYDRGDRNGEGQARRYK